MSSSGQSEDTSFGALAGVHYHTVGPAGYCYPYFGDLIPGCDWVEVGAAEPDEDEQVAGGGVGFAGDD